MPMPYVHRPQQLALAIALSLGCIELSMAQVETAAAVEKPSKKDVAAPWPKKDDLLAIKNFIGPKVDAVKPASLTPEVPLDLTPSAPIHREPVDVAIDMSEYEFSDAPSETASVPMSQVETAVAVEKPGKKDVAAPWPKKDDLLAIKNFIGPKEQAVKPTPLTPEEPDALAPSAPIHREPVDVAIDMSEYEFSDAPSETASVPMSQVETAVAVEKPGKKDVAAPWPKKDDLLAIKNFIGPKEQAVKPTPLTPEEPDALAPSLPLDRAPMDLAIRFDEYLKFPDAASETAEDSLNAYDKFSQAYTTEHIIASTRYEGVDGVALALKDGDDLLIVNKGASFDGEIRGGGGLNALLLNSEEGGTLGRTSNFSGLRVAKGAWSVTGRDDFAIGVEVMGGAKLFNLGSIAGDGLVYEGAMYGGHGEIRNLLVEGTLLVNKSLGAPHVHGDLTLTKESTLLYAITADGKPSTIVVDGTAELWNASLNVVALPGNYSDSNQYTVLKAGKVEGDFGRVTSNLAYMTPTLSRSETEVTLNYARNGLPVDEFASNDNSRQFGQSVAQPTPTANAAITALLGSSEETAAIALDQLSGYSTANLAKLTLNSDAPVSTSMLSAMRQLGTDAKPDGRNNSPHLAAGSDDNGRVWLQALGHGGKLDRNFDVLQHSTKGLVMGADWRIDEEWRLGVMGAKSQTRLDGRLFDGALESWHLGAYALRQNGPMALRLGATHSSHDGSTKRQIAFNGFRDRPKGSYDANTQQVFAEVGYNLGRDAYSIEPFASLGYQRYQRGSYTEKGGDASLQVQGQTRNNVNSTFGLRVAKLSTLDNGMQLTPRFSAGWKHTYGELNSYTRQKLVTEDARYTVEGAALDRNSVTLDAGLDLSLSARQTLGVGVIGEIGTDSRNHGVTGQWRMSF